MELLNGDACLTIMSCYPYCRNVGNACCRRNVRTHCLLDRKDTCHDCGFIRLSMMSRTVMYLLDSLPNKFGVETLKLSWSYGVQSHRDLRLDGNFPTGFYNFKCVRNTFATCRRRYLSLTRRN